VNARVALVVVLFAVAPALARSPGQKSLDEGVAWYKQGRFKEAMTSFRQAVDLDPSLTKAWENLGWAEHRLGDDREALRIWTTVLKLEPDNVATWNAVGEVELARGDAGAAAAAFESSVHLRPDQSDVRLRLGQADEDLGRLDAAAAQYRAILERHAGDAKATIRLADLEEGRGQLEAAEAVLRAGIAKGKDKGRVLAQRLGRVRAKHGDAAFASERWDAAAGAYRDAARWDPDRAVYLVNLGWAERKAGQTDAAIATWKQALGAKAPNVSDLWRAIGDAERDASRPAAAREAYVEAARADPGSRSALFALASISLDQGRKQEAVEALRAMLTSQGATVEDAVRAADLFVRDGAIETGEGLFESLASDPLHAEGAMIALARLHAAEGGSAYRLGDNAAAAASYRQALEADPRNRAALRDYGWTLWRVADWDGVRRVWGSYIAAYPELPEPHELMGRWELQHGDPKAAIAQAQEALAKGGEALGPEILLTKAYLADGKYQRARQLGATLAAAHPDDLAVQTVYAETLWRGLDFASAKTQWRKVIDMGGSSPRAMHYWLRSLYETGEADEAVAAAEAEVAKGDATEPVMRLLAEDALVRADDTRTIRWYRELTVRYPQRVGYWTALAEAYSSQESYREALKTLDAALAAHPDSPELALLRAEAELTLRHGKRALDAYRSLADRLGRNRSVFEGRVESLRLTGRLDEALALLRSDGPAYLDADERALEEASILEDEGRRAEAAGLRQRVIAPRGGSVVLPVLLYHGISDHERTLNVPLARFEGEMQALHDAGFSAITVSDLDAMLAGRARFPDKPIVITFDDARSDSFRYADPVLARYGMKATMFVPTVRIADESAFNTDWATLRRLAATGRWDFQAHGHLAHDPIPVDGQGGLAEFLVNRAWLPDAERLETHDEFAARVEGDYEACRARLVENLPGHAVVAYAFPFSEMGQLHGGNDPQALDVNESAFRKLYRFGFIQDSTGYNTLALGERGAILLRRLSVKREWDADRLLAHLASEAPAERARLDGAEADLANAEHRKAESDVKRMIEERPATYAKAGVTLSYALHEQGREREAQRAYALVPTSPSWGRPDAGRRKLARDISWETDPQTGPDVRVVSDSDHRDSLQVLATGRYPFDAPVDLWGSVGSAQFRDAVLPDLSGFQGTLGATWLGPAHVALGGWLRGRSLGPGVDTLEGQATVRGGVDGQRFGAACGVTDVETVGALQDGIQSRGCDGAYDVFGRNWSSRSRLAYGSLTDGNAIVYGWADGTVSLERVRNLSVGGRLDVGDSRETSPLYYAPSGLVTAVGIVRYARSFPSGASLEAEAGIGPSRDSTSSVRAVGQARFAWTQDWGVRWRSALTAEYGETPDYRRTALSFSFGYRF
jgi:tetratricopeptide (TPR) repeat protein